MLQREVKKLWKYDVLLLSTLPVSFLDHSGLFDKKKRVHYTTMTLNEEG